jgi:hypothetical protein
MATVSHPFGGFSHAGGMAVRTLLVAALLTAVPGAVAQPAPTPAPSPAPAPPPAPAPNPAPDTKPRPAVPAISTDTPEDDSFITDADARKRKAEMERELKRIRLKHFGSIRKVEIRQEGIARVRQYTDPLIFPALVKIFEKEKHDIRVAILDHLLDQNTPEADVTIAWIAAFDRDEVIRGEAIARLTQHVQPGTTPPVRIKYMIVQGLKSSSPEKQLGAAQLAETLKFFEAIPWLITAQFGGPGSSSGTVAEPRGDLAYIVIGQQTAFVSDLTPIVGDSAVGFDPTLSTLTTGTILRIQDASVTTYITLIQPVLVRMTSEAWGQSTDGLGYDGREWWGWYRQEYLPFLSAKLAAGEDEVQGEPPVQEPPTPPSQPAESPTPTPASPVNPSPSDDGSGTNTPPKR